ncbi:glycine zipper family protein [Martelella alba]|uniref:Glycine zipper family protein n=1 Tax=Martelella alba TaxID=2590451 RepID=A0ABY2SNU0_9HYPH|nr:glycine zipper family protein [Martelella alba]TKI06959.1 glycine zipper family protein [Martelella alba]
MNRTLITALPLLAGLALSGCASTPTAPSVMALPGSNKTYDQFRYDDVTCRNAAYSSLSGAADNANGRALATVAAGTAIGTAAGALLGSPGGPRGTANGAAVGAAGGLLAGTAVAGGNNSQGALQDQYDMIYIQCMYAKGEKVPASYAWAQQEDPAAVPPDYHP